MAMTDPTVPGNKRDRLQWFNDIGFGLFIHWSIDSQIGSVIGHSMAGASEDYLRNYTEILPSTFNPKKFDPDEWAVLAKLAGIRYVVFTTKHHSGFCMFHTSTTPFNIANTPFKRDITGEVIEAFRKQDIAVGLYFSPDDFYFLRAKKLPLRRGVKPEQCEGLLEHNQAQLRELLQNYGKVDILFFDGPSDGLREMSWEIDAEIVVTRGAIKTPEQYIPGVPSDEPWEACVTMGTGWQYKPTNEHYKSGTQLIELLIETRAKGGNLILNVGPKPDGELPIEQEALLREIALWNFVNGEAIYQVQPWRVPFEGDVWFTKKNEDDTVYAFVESASPWPFRERRELSLTSVRAGAQTTVHVLGQADDAMVAERAAVEWHQEGERLQISAARTQRLYNNRRWPNPVVLKITHAQLGLVPPTVKTGEAVWEVDSSSCLLHANLADLGENETVEVGFQYRVKKLLTESSDEWQESAFERLQSTGEYKARIGNLENATSYEFRAVARHRTMAVYGDSVTLRTG
jgi:alpha-L-fucosidase